MDELVVLAVLGTSQSTWKDTRQDCILTLSFQNSAQSCPHGKITLICSIVSCATVIVGQKKGTSNGKKASKNVLRYFPIISRLKKFIARDILLRRYNDIA